MDPDMHDAPKYGVVLAWCLACSVGLCAATWLFAVLNEAFKHCV